jgi:hypothetical protein
MLDLYCIEGTSNICSREIDGPEYNSPETWPTFQKDWITLKNDIIGYVLSNKSILYLRIFDGEFYFLEGIKAGNVGTRHCSVQLTPDFLKKFRDGFLKADIVSSQLYSDQLIKYNRIFPERCIDIPMELIYCLVSTRWIFKQFPNQIALIGGTEKIKTIQELMKYPEYREYIGTDLFTDYISVPERYTCDNTEEIVRNIKQNIQQSNAKIFLFGIGIGKLAIAHQFKEMNNAIFIDVGCGISALAGTTSIERPYFGSWINYRLKNWNYNNMDPIDFYDTPNLNIKILD